MHPSETLDAVLGFKKCRISCVAFIDTEKMEAQYSDFCQHSVTGMSTAKSNKNRCHRQRGHLGKKNDNLVS